MPDIEKNIEIEAPIETVWSALTDPEVIGTWMSDDSIKIELKAGGRYAVFGGETTGTFIVVEKPKLLEYTWRQSTWPTDWPDSVVRWQLNKSKGGTRLSLLHTQFPNDEERNNHDEDWDIYWLEPMIDWLETEAE